MFVFYIIQISCTCTVSAAFVIIITRWNPFKDIIPDGMSASGPLCFFNTSNSDAVVVSPLTQVMHVSPWHRRWDVGPQFSSTEGQSYWGIDRDLISLPAGFKVEVILVYSPDGIRKVS